MDIVLFKILVEFNVFESLSKRTSTSIYFTIMKYVHIIRNFVVLPAELFTYCI